MKYYVIADPHGYYMYTRKALREAGFFDESEPCKLIVCGDLLDRGGQAYEMVEFMLRLKEEDKLIYILGNHEDLFVRCLQQIAAGEVYEIACGMSHHHSNGTWDTLLQLSEMSEADAIKNPNELVRRIRASSFYRKLLPSAVDYYETQNYVFVHGWLPCSTEIVDFYERRRYDPQWREAERDDWRMARWFNGMDMACKAGIKEPGKTVVCGHWHASYGHAVLEGRGTEWGDDADFSPFCADGIIAMDSCAAASQRVNCIVIEEKET